MNKEYNYFLSLLKSFLHNTTPPTPGGIDWSKLLDLARIHSLVGVLGYMVITHKLSDSPQVLAFMRKCCMDTIGLYAARNQSMRKLIDEMNKIGIEHILFKGYVVKDYYPVPELRTYGDIDFVIRLEDRAKSHQLMRDLGYQVKNDWEAVYSYYKTNEYYEIHSDIMEVDVSDKADYRGYFKDMWNHTVDVGGYSREFTPEYHFIYLLTHIAKHIYGSGAGIRMYLDLALFVKHFGTDIDWDEIRRQLEILKLYDFYCTVMTAIKQWFDVESPIKIKKVSEETMNAFVDFTMEGGVYGYVNREKGVNALKQTGGNESQVSRVGVLLRRLFPSAGSIESRYTYLKGRHWLLPVAWVHRLVLTRKKWSGHAHEAKVIMSADTEEVMLMKKIYKDIGL